MDDNNMFLTPQETLLLEQLQAKKIQSMQFEIARLSKDNQLLFTELHTVTNDMRLIKEDLNNQYEKINYQHQKTTKDYLGLGQLGALHSPAIGAHYTGILLRKVGLCKQHGNTQPKSEHTTGNNPLSINKVGEAGFMSWYYHYDKTWNYIKKFLDENGLRNDFESCKNKDEIHKFISNI